MAYDSGYNPYIFNSNWSSLQIAFERNISVAASSTETVPHGLGFYPLTMVWYINSSGESLDNFYYYPFIKAQFDTDNIYIINGSSETLTASIKCYNLDISVPIEEDETTLKPSLLVDYNTTGINTNIDMRNYILHSRCQSPAVFKVAADNEGNGLTYILPTDYNMWTLGFYSPIGDNTRYQCAMPWINDASPTFFQLPNPNRVIIWPAFGDSGARSSIVVVRDPLFIPSETEVIYE